MDDRQMLDRRLARATRAIASLEKRVGGSIAKAAHALGMACQALREAARFSKGDVYLIQVLESAANQIANAAISLGAPHGSYEAFDSDVERLRKAANEVMDHTYGAIGAACYALLMACYEMEKAIASSAMSSANFALPMTRMANAAGILARLVPGRVVSSDEQGFTDIVKEKLSNSAERDVAFEKIEKERLGEDAIRYKSTIHLNGYPITYFSFRPGDSVWTLKDETAIVLGLDNHMHYWELSVGQKRVRAALEQADAGLISLCVDANRGFTP